jgi:hypothetical protein
MNLNGDKTMNLKDIIRFSCWLDDITYMEDLYAYFVEHDYPKVEARMLSLDYRRENNMFKLYDKMCMGIDGKLSSEALVLYKYIDEMFKLWESYQTKKQHV